jgi:hypothetical protein
MTGIVVFEFVRVLLLVIFAACYFRAASEARRFRKDHEAMESLRQRKAHVVAYEHGGRWVWRSWTHGEQFWAQSDASGSSDPAEAIRKAVEFREKGGA